MTFGFIRSLVIQTAFLLLCNSTIAVRCENNEHVSKELFRLFFNILHKAAKHDKQSKRAILVVWQTRKFKYVTKYKTSFASSQTATQHGSEIHIACHQRFPSAVPSYKLIYGGTRASGIRVEEITHVSAIDCIQAYAANENCFMYLTSRLAIPNIFFTNRRYTVNIFDFTHYTVDTWRNQLIAEMLQFTANSYTVKHISESLLGSLY